MTKKEALKILKSWDGYMFLEREEGHVGYSYKKDVSQEAINVAIETLQNERPQGKWARTGQSFVNPNKFRNFCCSNCFWELDEHIRVEPNFCPNCGADMRGKKKNE